MKTVYLHGDEVSFEDNGIVLCEWEGTLEELVAWERRMAEGDGVENPQVHKVKNEQSKQG